MKGYNEKYIHSKFKEEEIVSKVEKGIEFVNEDMKGTRGILKRYYGFQVGKNSYKLWRKPTLTRGIFDAFQTRPFFLIQENQGLTLRFEHDQYPDLVLIIYTVAAINAAAIVYSLGWPIWTAVGGPVLAFMIKRGVRTFTKLTDESIKEDFEKMIRE